MTHSTVCRLDLEKLVADQVPDYKNYPKDRKFRIKCPYCEHDKTPALSVLRNFKVGLCYRCEKIFVNDNTNSKLTVDSLYESFKDITPTGLDKNSLRIMNESIFSLYSKIDHNEFLEKRNPFVHDWNYYGIRQGDDEVITPYYMFGEMVYFQIRRYNPRGFYNPKEVNAPLYIPSDARSTPGLWYQDCPTVLVEGPFDAIAYDCVRRSSKRKFNIAALGGKVMTPFRLELLKQLGVSRILVNLDESKLSYDLKESIGTEFGRRNVTVIPSNGDDPEEVLRAEGLEKFSEYVLSYIFETNMFRDKSYYTKDMNCKVDSGNFKINFN